MGLETSKGAMPSLGIYDLVEKIAEGGMGAIYRGRNRVTGEPVAVKVLPPHMAANPVMLKRFEQEFRAASRLNHPNIVRALDYGEVGSSPYLVMEYVEGESLGQKLERDGRMGEAEAIRIIAQVAQGLHRAHKQNLIHRDVKPDNILIRTDGLAKLADLGLVKETDTELNLTKTGRGLGTPHFMAPEQFRNAKGVDTRCDIYSLAATLYVMVTATLPFKSNGPLDTWMKKIQNDLVPPQELVPGLSDRTNWAILRAMSARAEERPASCREFIEDLTGQSTKRLPAAGAAGSTGSLGAPAPELWYLVYKDEYGVTHTVKGSTSAIRRSLREGVLGDASNVRASRSKAGPFGPLRECPEFRDLLVTAAPLAALAAGPPARPYGAEPAAPPAQPAGSGAQLAPVPHIRLGRASRQAAASSGGWLAWLLLFLLAAVSAAAAFWLAPGRWWRW
jgi:hypothetical protein